MKKMHLWMVMDPYLLAVASIDVSSDASSANTYIKFAAVTIQKRKDFYQKEKGSIADIANASALTKTSETSAGTASKRRPAPQTLHAAVNGAENGIANGSPKKTRAMPRAQEVPTLTVTLLSPPFTIVLFL